LRRLKSGLDAESCAHIDNIFERYVFVTPRQRYSAYFLCDERLMFTAEERQAQRQIQAEFSEAAAKQQFPLPIDYYPPAIFHYDDGLAFLSPQQRERLRGTDIIDGGAWIGDSALVFTKYEPARIFCFEPIEANYKMLLETIRLNPHHNIVAVRAGLGEGDRKLELFGDLTDASINPEVLNVNTDASRQKREVIDITSIDHYVSQHGVRPGLISSISKARKWMHCTALSRPSAVSGRSSLCRFTTRRANSSGQSRSLKIWDWDTRSQSGGSTCFIRRQRPS